MKRQWRGLLLLCMPMLLLDFAGCGGGQAVVADGERFEGENCSKEFSCKPGLSCYGGICRKVCQGDGDCKEDQECNDNLCVPRTSESIISDLDVGEDCNNTNRFCKAGLTCVSGKCKKACKNHQQCGADEYCSNNECVPRPTPGVMGADCDDEIALCESGLDCVEGKCAHPCAKSADCPKDSKYLCIANYCVVDTTGAPSKVEVTGAVLSPASAMMKSSNAESKLRVRVISGALQSSGQAGDKIIHLQDGAWKLPSKE